MKTLLFIAITMALGLSEIFCRDGDMFLKICERMENKLFDKTSGTAKNAEVSTELFYQTQYFMKCGQGKAFHLKCLDGSSGVILGRPYLNQFQLKELVVKEGYKWVTDLFQKYQVDLKFLPEAGATASRVFKCVNSIRPMLHAKGIKGYMEYKVYVYANAFEMLPDYCLPSRHVCGCNYCHVGDVDAVVKAKIV